MSVRSSCSLPSLLFFPFAAIFPPLPPPPPPPPPPPTAVSKADVKADDEEGGSEEDETASALRLSAEPLAAARAAPLRPSEEQLSEREESSTLRLRGVELDLHFSGTS